MKTEGDAKSGDIKVLETPQSTFQYLKGATRELESDFLQGHGVTGQGGMMKL